MSSAFVEALHWTEEMVFSPTGMAPVQLLYLNLCVCVCVHVNVDSRRLGKNKQKCDVAELEEALSCFFVLCCFFSFFLGRKKVRNSKHTV